MTLTEKLQTQDYNAVINDDGFIQLASGKTLGVKLLPKRNRIHYTTESGELLGTSPATPQGFAKFVESFWYWSKAKP